MSDVVAKRIFMASAAFMLACGAFLGGLIVERYQIWPYAIVHEAFRVITEVAQFGESIPTGRRVAAPPNASREVFTVRDPARVTPGYYVFVLWDDAEHLYSAWLYDEQGSRRHVWRFHYDELDPDGPWNGEDHPHPFYLLPDASVLVAFDSGDIMTRLDSCSEPMWIKHGIYHHALSQADDGTFWIWRGDGTPYGHYHYMENFDPETGETLREIGLIEDILAKSGEASFVFAVRPDFPFERFDRDPEFRVANDIFHPNDLDVLSENFAPQFPMFDTGDLLLSFRTFNLVAVIDPDTATVKWWQHGPWIGQHDPDFTADGKISIYNNNSGRGRSEILKIDPLTRSIENELFYGDAQFYTEFMGKQQYLPDGNILITVPGEGRVIEVTSDGKTVMEFNNIVADFNEYNDHVQNAMWVPADYFESPPACAD